MDFSTSLPIDELYTAQVTVARESGCLPGDVLRQAAKHGYTTVRVAGRPMFYTKDALELIEKIKAGRAARDAMKGAT